MHEAVNLVHAVAWPGVALIALLMLRSEIAGLLRRIKQLKFKKFNVVLELASEIARSIPAGDSLDPPVDSSKAQSEFDQLGAEYRDLSIANLEQRVAERRRLSDRLGTLAVQLDLDRNALSAGHEGERVALATAAVLKPRKGDLARLLVAATPAPGTTLYRFTGYRIVLALTPSLSLGAGKRRLTLAAKVLRAVQDRARAQGDEALQRLIDRTRSVLDEARSRR